MSNLIGHGHKDNVIWVMGHSIKRCFKVSYSELHNGQRRESIANLSPRVVLVGNTPLLSYKEIASVSHEYSASKELTTPTGPEFPNRLLWSTQYVDLVEKEPVEAPNKFIFMTAIYLHERFSFNF